MFTTPTSTVNDLLANVSDQLADVGTLAVIAAAVALPLVFWAARRIIGLFPKGK